MRVRLASLVGLRAIWSALDAGAAPLGSLLLATGLVRALGIRNYGMAVVALAVSGLSTAVNPAIVAATTRMISASIGLQKTQTLEIARTVSAALCTVGLIDIVLLCGVYVYRGELINLIYGATPPGRPHEAQGVLILAVLSVCLQQVDAIFAAILRGCEKFKQQAIAELCSRAALIGASIFVAFRTRNILLTFATYAMVCAVYAAGRGVLARWLSPEQRLLALPHAEHYRQLLSLGGWMWLNALATVAFGTLDRVLIGRMLGPVSVARFSVYVQISQLIHFVPSSLFAFCFPVFSRLSVDPDPARLPMWQLYRRSYAGSILTGALISALMIVGGRKAVTLVGGAGLQEFDSLVFVLLVAGFMLLVLNVVPYALLLGCGEFKSVSMITSGAMLAAVILATILIPPFGLEGAAMARLAYGGGALLLLRKVGHLRPT